MLIRLCELGKFTRKYLIHQKTLRFLIHWILTEAEYNELWDDFRKVIEFIFLSLGASGKCHCSCHCCHLHCDPWGFPERECCPVGRSTGAGHQECWLGCRSLCIRHLASSFHSLICSVLTSIVSSVLQIWKRRHCCSVTSLQSHSEDESGRSLAPKAWSVNPRTECCLFVRARSISILSTYYALSTCLIKFSLTLSG